MADREIHNMIHGSRSKKAYISPEMQAKIDKAMEQVKNGEVYTMRENESLDDFLDRVKDDL